ncbi:GPI transamidase component PIG-T [Trichonephila inaurata madagascariensis]|uniref:GPI transamidase component PIG-T n=1 Tax=Trichonephila inaurata madagascariensis TaxID=2747483 RepID=A0A8X6XS72_9ARAC|nr:GPI transamidase component PIG-T [Trichonephila inaurata madagascariensis]
MKVKDSYRLQGFIPILSFVVVLFIVPKTCKSSSFTDRFDEKLFIKPLPSGHVYTHFQFVVQKDLNGNDNNPFHHFRLFPRSLGEIIFQHDVQELHFSLTQGLWRYEKWGYPTRSAPPGAELWALFKGNASEITSNWKKLTHMLSGQFCASLNFIEDSNTAIPKHSFRPEGAVPFDHPYNSSYVRYSALPHEIVCTENLTPFRKLLPCGAQAGLSTLLNALNIFSAHYVSLAVDVHRVCKKDCSEIALELIQSISIVFDPPVQQLKKQDWSFVKLFGSSLLSTCPVATTSQVFVDITSNKSGIPFVLNSKPHKIIKEKFEIYDGYMEENEYAFYDLKRMFQETKYVNIGSNYNSIHIYGIIPSPVLYVDRKVSGYGQEQGGIHCTFYNNHPKKSLKILYFDMIPWYMRLYSHTLAVKNGNKVIDPDYLYYQPAKDRSRPHHLELVLTLPPNSKSEMSIEFDFAFLKWTEYPPDANHGFYAGSAVISVLLDTARNFSRFPESGHNGIDKGNFLRIYTQILLVSLPTPDFSMPYNVICLTCTVVALAFGPIHNITTKSLQPIEDNKENSFIAKLKKKLKKLWGSKEDDKTAVVNEPDTKKTQ